MEAFTARNVAKFAVTNVIRFQVAGLAHTTIVDHTRFEDDDMIVDLASAMVGWGIADKLKPYTNRVVDVTADFVAEKRAARAAKKTTTEEK